ncbi:MAG: class I SAM-dependent methyltransferase [Planctomycetes bacterium]|nr:class I SAM-dependent methyltransferase [Planctomycetota bacterium]
MEAPRVERVPCPLCRDGSGGRLKWRGRDRLMGVPGEYAVVECNQCGFYYQNPRPLQADLHLCYPPEYPAYNPESAAGHKLLSGSPARVAAHRYILSTQLGYKHLAPENAGLFARILAFTRAAKVKKTVFPMRGGGRLLDVGCSTGARMTAMKALGWVVAGIEFSPDVAAVAKREHNNVFAGDIQNAPFPERSFDLITCYHVLEHVADPRAVLTKMIGWLAPGGMLVIESPNAAGAGAEEFGTHWFLLDLPRHFHHFTPATLSRMIQLCGGAVVKLEHESSVGALAGSIQFRDADAGLPRKDEKRLKRSLRRRAWWGRATGRGEILRVYVAVANSNERPPHS